MCAATIKDVAKRASVGIGTVSRVINNHPRVSIETRERVLQAIHELSYRPDLNARRLTQRVQLRNIGVILPLVSYYSFIERLRGVQLALSHYDSQYELVLYPISSVQRSDEQMSLIARQRSLAGLIVICMPVSEAHQALFHRLGIELVGIADRPDPSWTCVALDNIAAAALAIEHLIDLGHTRIAYVGDSLEDEYGFTTSLDRYQGYRQALERHGLHIRPEYIRLGEHGRDVAQRMTAELLALPQPPTAIFAMSDLQAFGCISAVKNAGLRVPEDISVVGFDDLEISHYAGLTTINQHLQDSGRIAAECLLRLFNYERITPPELPPAELVIRQTTAAPL